MIKVITRNQIVDKIRQFIDSGFGTPVPDHFVFAEVGDSKAYDQLHIQKAIYLSPKQIEQSAKAQIPNLGEEVIVYSDAAHRELAQGAAHQLSQQGYRNIYLYPEGKEDWHAAGLWMSTTLVPADQARIKKAKHS